MGLLEMKKLIIMIAFSVIFGLATMAIPAEKTLCLPPGVTETDLKTWKPVGAQQRVVEGENNETIGLTLVALQASSGMVVLGWVDDVVVYFDWAPEDASIAPLVNNQMVTLSNLMRVTPVGPCGWRKVGPPASSA